MSAAHQLAHQIRLGFGSVSQTRVDELLEEMPVALAPVIEGAVQAATILGGFANRSADDLRPAVGHLEEPNEIGVREPDAAGLG